MDNRALPAHWQTTTLAAIARSEYGLIDGPFGSSLPASSYTDRGIPVIRGSNLSVGHERFIDEEFVYVSNETANRLHRSLCKAGDIIFTKKGTLGQTGIVPANHRFSLFLVSSNQMKLSVNPDVADALFVYYYVSSPDSVEKIIRDAEATGVPKTNLVYLRQFPIVLPPLSEQRAIAHILGSLDDKIELNRRMNQTLEAMARAVFQSWFVDFDPVHAKARGESPAGMDAATAALFPDGFVETALGPVPRGWRVGNLSEITEVMLGGDWGVSEAKGEILEPTYCIRGADIPPLQIADEAKMPVRYLKSSSLSKRRLTDGDIVMEISGGSPTQSTGRPLMLTNALFARFEYPIVYSNFCRLIRVNNRVLSEFVYYWLRYLYDQGAFFVFETGTTGIKNFSITSFSEQFPLVLPPIDILHSYQAIIRPILDHCQNNGAESTTLTAIRDTLLPKLMSGELRVPEAAEMAEA